MTTTATQAHRPTPRTNMAAHNAAERRRAAENEAASKEARKLQAKRRIQAIYENPASPWQSSREGLRRTLLNFKLRNHPTTLPAGAYLMRAISLETGEIRLYKFKESYEMKFVGNADYVLNNGEATIYQTYVRTGYEATSWKLIDSREAGH